MSDQTNLESQVSPSADAAPEGGLSEDEKLMHAAQLLHQFRDTLREILSNRFQPLWDARQPDTIIEPPSEYGWRRLAAAARNTDEVAHELSLFFYRHGNAAAYAVPNQE